MPFIRSYEFSRHVGYITPRHSSIVRDRGPSAIHRRSFAARCYEPTIEVAPELAEYSSSSVRLPRRGRGGTTGCAGTRSSAANVRSGGVELDIVCRRGRQLVVCEVKDKRDGRYGDPLEMVDDRKQERLRRGAEAWLPSHPAHRTLELRFDVVAERGTTLERVEHAF